jgi:hypothetical protein
LPRRHALVLLAAFVAIGSALPGVARADGDPASDILLGQDVFVPYGVASSAADDLDTTVRAANRGGQRVKVAVIASRADMGAVSQLFGQPKQYAKFLAAEIRNYYAGPLLVVMPSGFGVYDAGRDVGAQERTVAALGPPGRTPRALLDAANRAVASLSRAGGLAWRDILPPLVVQRFTPARPGRTVTLQFFVLDDSGRSRETLTVLAGRRKLHVVQLPLGPTTSSTAHGAGTQQAPPPLEVRWRAPDPLPRNLRYCVTASDAAGNRSKPGCIWLQVHSG